MSYIILIFFTAIMMVLSYLVFKKDIITPSFIVCGTYFFSVFSAYIAKIFKLWNYVDLQPISVIIVIVGVASFVLGEYIIRKKIIMNKKNGLISEFLKKDIIVSKIIHISNIKYLIITGFVISCLIIIYCQLIKITGISNNIPLMINSYRESTPLFNNSTKSTSISTFAMQLYRISEIIAIVFMYIIINNIICKDKLLKNAKYVIPIFCFIATSLLIAGRSALIRLIIAGVFLTLLLMKKYYHKKLNYKKIFLYGMIIIILLVPLFYCIMPLIGRNQRTNIIEYVSFYVGSPVPSLNELIVRDELGHSNFWGEETFKGIQAFLSKVNIIQNYSPYQNQWISFKNLSNNTFTGLKTYYSDFGIIGVFVCQILFAFLLTILYILARHNNKKIFLLLWGMYGTKMVMDQYRVEELFSNLFNYETVIYLIYMIIVVNFVFNNEKKRRRLLNDCRRGIVKN